MYSEHLPGWQEESETRMSALKSLATIEAFLAETTKEAEAYTEPGSQGGPTSHPSKNVDDRTQVAREGARAKENERDNKDDIGPPAVDNAAELGAKSANFGQSMHNLASGVENEAHRAGHSIANEARRVGGAINDEAAKARAELYNHRGT